MGQHLNYHSSREVVEDGFQFFAQFLNIFLPLLMFYSVLILPVVLEKDKPSDFSDHKPCGFHNIYLQYEKQTHSKICQFIIK